MVNEPLWEARRGEANVAVGDPSYSPLAAQPSIGARFGRQSE